METFEISRIEQPLFIPNLHKERKRPDWATALAKRTSRRRKRNKVARKSRRINRKKIVS